MTESARLRIKDHILELKIKYADKVGTCKVCDRKEDLDVIQSNGDYAVLALCPHHPEEVRIIANHEAFKL